MVREFTVIQDMLSDPDKEGNQKIIIRGMESKLLINLADIRFVSEFFTRKGKPIKTKCQIKTVDNDFFILKHSYSTIKNMLHIGEKSSPIGFKYKNRR